MMTFIYVLQLQHGCFYVGKSDNPQKRLLQHKNNRGSAWTRLHKPVRLIKKIKMTSTLQEDQITEELMKKKGIDKVRGGMYCQIDLPSHVQETLTTKLFHASDVCLRCGSPGHFAKQCTAKEEWECDHCPFTGSYQQVERHEKQCRRKRRRKSCARCGRDSHAESNCYAKTSVNGDRLDSLDEESEEELDEGVYEVDNEVLYWDGDEWYEESKNSPGHRDGTISVGGPHMKGFNDYNWRPIKRKKKKAY